MDTEYTVTLTVTIQVRAPREHPEEAVRAARASLQAPWGNLAMVDAIERQHPTQEYGWEPVPVTRELKDVRA
jgi:hypothetical protein